MEISKHQTHSYLIMLLLFLGLSLKILLITMRKTRFLLNIFIFDNYLCLINMKYYLWAYTCQSKCLKWNLQKRNMKFTLCLYFFFQVAVPSWAHYSWRQKTTLLPITSLPITSNHITSYHILSLPITSLPIMLACDQICVHKNYQFELNV